MNIFSLVPKAMEEIGAVGKNGKNKDQNYAFRKVDDVYNAAQPVFAKLGIFMVPKVLDTITDFLESKNGSRQIRVKLRVEFTLYAADGSNVSGISEGESIDSSDKATNKAMTAAFKYFMIQTFCIAIESEKDMDTDNESPDVGLPQDPADYIIPFGKKYNGKRVGDIDAADLQGYVLYMEKSAKDEGKTLTGQYAEGIGIIKKYLAIKFNRPTGAPPKARVAAPAVSLGGNHE